LQSTGHARFAALQSIGPSFTLGYVACIFVETRAFLYCWSLLFVAASIWLAVPGAALAQIPGQLPGFARPSDPIDQARQRALAPVPRTPGTPVPQQQWVPERRFYSPELGRELVVPGHYEGRISDQQFAVPPMTGYGPQGQNPVPIPGGERPPADLRQGP